MDVLKAVGKQICVIRKAQSLTQEDLGEKTNLSPNYLGLVERGQKQVTLRTLADIAKALKVDMATLFETCATKGRRSPIEAEVAALLEVVRELGIEDVKALRGAAERMGK